MVHALSNNGYSVNVKIVTIHICFFVKLSFKILHTNKYTGSTTSNRLIEILNLVLIANLSFNCIKISLLNCQMVRIANYINTTVIIITIMYINI